MKSKEKLELSELWMIDLISFLFLHRRQSWIEETLVWVTEYLQGLEYAKLCRNLNRLKKPNKILYDSQET